MKNYDVTIIGAGAAGLMCAMEAGKRGRSVLLIDHSKKIAEKIRISGGGRCNFTNLNIRPEAYLSDNPHFCKSALKQYTQHDFIALVEKHNIDYHEKTLGQLFCDGSSKKIIDMLVNECEQAGVDLKMETCVDRVQKTDDETYRYQLSTSIGDVKTQSLVIASGGLSIPKIGATSFGYDIAKQFDLALLMTYPALVPFTFQTDILDMCKELSGLSVNAIVACNNMSFREGLLFTHRGLSGPSILQISSYWSAGDAITVNLLPDIDIVATLQADKQNDGKKDVQTALSKYLPKRLASKICELQNLQKRLADLTNKDYETLNTAIHEWSIKPAGTEGYRTAEVTLKGVNTNEISSKTMECKKHKGLYFIGEVVDVTGHLGGYNFQWAWSSGYVAGQYA